MKKGLKIKKSKVNKALEAIAKLDQEEDDQQDETTEKGNSKGKSSSSSKSSYSPTSSRNEREGSSSSQESPAKGEMPSRRSALDAMEDLLEPSEEDEPSVNLPGNKLSKSKGVSNRSSKEESDDEEEVEAKAKAKAKEDKKNTKLSKKDRKAIKSASDLLRKARKDQEEDGEGDEESDEVGEGNEGKWSNEEERGGLEGQPDTPSKRKHGSKHAKTEKSNPIPPNLYNKLQAELADIFEQLPVNPKETRREIDSYLNKLQNLALKKAELMLKSFALDTSPSELIKMVKELKEMQLTNKWTKKLERVILENPSKLLPPGTRGGWTLLSKVKEMSQQIKNAKEQDGRKSGIKQSNSYVANNPNEVSLDLPEEPEQGKSNAV